MSSTPTRPDAYGSISGYKSRCVVMVVFAQQFAAARLLQESLTSFTNLCDLAAEITQIRRSVIVANDPGLRNTDLDKNSPHVDAAAIGFQSNRSQTWAHNRHEGEGAMDRPRCSACFSVGFPHPAPLTRTPHRPDHTRTFGQQQGGRP